MTGESYAMQIGPRSFTTLMREEIKAMGSAMSTVAERGIAAPGFSKSTVGRDLAAIALACHDGGGVFATSPPNYDFHVVLGNNTSVPTYIGDSQTLLEFVGKLLKSIADNAKGSTQALAWFMDGLITNGKIGGKEVIDRGEVQNLMTSIIRRYNEIEADVGHIKDLDNELPCRDLKYTRLLAFAPDSSTNPTYSPKYDAVLFSTVANASDLMACNVTLQDAGNVWRMSTQLHVEENGYDALVDKDSVAGRILQEMYNRAPNIPKMVS